MVSEILMPLPGSEFALKFVRDHTEWFCIVDWHLTMRPWLPNGFPVNPDPGTSGSLVDNLERRHGKDDTG